MGDDGDIPDTLLHGKTPQYGKIKGRAQGPS
jgi:hypothetical protein